MNYLYIKYYIFYYKRLLWFIIWHSRGDLLFCLFKKKDYLQIVRKFSIGANCKSWCQYEAFDFQRSNFGVSTSITTCITDSEVLKHIKWFCNISCEIFPQTSCEFFLCLYTNFLFPKKISANCVEVFYHHVVDEQFYFLFLFIFEVRGSYSWRSESKSVLLHPPLHRTPSVRHGIFCFHNS